MDTSKEAVELLINRCWLTDPEPDRTETMLRALLAERDTLRQQLHDARDKALEEAANVAISNAGSWEDSEGDAALVISQQIRALKGTKP